MIPASISKLRWPILACLIALSSLELYHWLAELLDLVIGRAAGRSGWIWLVAGPFLFFASIFIGSIFALVGSRVKPGPLWHVSYWVVTISFAGLGIGVLLAAPVEWKNGFAFTPLEHAVNMALLLVPMAVGAWVLRSFRTDMDRRELQSNIPNVPDAPTKNQSGIGHLAGYAFRWIGALIAAGGTALAMLVSALLLLIYGCEPPTVRTLARQFPAKRQGLEMIVTMANQDSDMAVIDPTWLERFGGGQSANSPIGITQTRWDQYRQLFRMNGLTQGVRRSDRPRGDAFLIVKSFGILERGYSTGYLYCEPAEEHRWAPCNSSETKGIHPYSHGDEAYEFIKVSDRWYAYSQGPG